MSECDPGKCCSKLDHKCDVDTLGQGWVLDIEGPTEMHCKHGYDIENQPLGSENQPPGILMILQNAQFGKGQDMNGQNFLNMRQIGPY